VSLAHTRATINAQRLLDNWHRLSTFRDPDQPGWTRRPFTPWYRQARAWLNEQMTAAGLATDVDAAGNLIGRRPGGAAVQRPLLVGSHSDTVAGGGRFDGIVGVLTAIEVAHSLHESGVSLQHPLEVIDYLAEEPTDFGISTVGSRALSGSLLPEHLKRTDAGGQTLGEAIASVGGAPDAIAAVARPNGSIAAALEAHIEQGPRLETERIPLGVVTAITGITRYVVHVHGRPDHAGGTPMGSRRDALAGAAEVILAVEGLWQPGEGVATVGRLNVTPNATNVVPGEAAIWVEIRSVDASRLERVCDAFLNIARDIANRRGLGIDLDLVSHEEPVEMPSHILELLASTLDHLQLPYLRMPSYAGHDTNQLAKIAPVGMLFVPSRDGRSHCPEEWTHSEDLVRGARALLSCVLAIDGALA
jgi:N-carbamoyl-L-amino-acid hydrolase